MLNKLCSWINQVPRTIGKMTAIAALILGACQETRHDVARTLRALKPIRGSFCELVNKVNEDPGLMGQDITSPYRAWKEKRLMELEIDPDSVELFIGFKGERSPRGELLFVTPKSIIGDTLRSVDIEIDWCADN